APVASAAARTSSSFPLPTRVAGLGRSRRAVTTAATDAPAERASSENSSSASSSGAPAAWGWISRACSPFWLRSNKRRALLGVCPHHMRPARRDVKPPPPRNALPERRSVFAAPGHRLRGAGFARCLHVAPARPHPDVAGRYDGGD